MVSSLGNLILILKDEGFCVASGGFRKESGLLLRSLRTGRQIEWCVFCEVAVGVYHSLLSQEKPVVIARE